MNLPFVSIESVLCDSGLPAARKVDGGCDGVVLQPFSCPCATLLLCLCCSSVVLVLRFCPPSDEGMRATLFSEGTRVSYNSFTNSLAITAVRI